MKSNYSNKIFKHLNKEAEKNKNLHCKHVFTSKKKLSETLYFYKDAGFTDAGTMTSKYYKHHIMKKNNEIIMINILRNEGK